MQHGRIAWVGSALTLVALHAGPALAYRPMPIDVECPIDGRRFGSVEMGSGTQFCLRLDLKPVGAIPAPAPIHSCPNDGYVWHRDDLSESEMDRVRDWVRSDAYQQLRSESPYFRLARIYERVGRDSWQIAHAFLNASWEVEANPDRYRKYLGESHSHLVRHLEQAGAQLFTSARNERVARQILAGELERQLGMFDAARARFEKLRQDAGATPIERTIVDYELQLVAGSDREPHYVPGDDPDEERCRSYDRKRGSE